MPARFPRLGVVYVQSHQPPPHLATIRNIFRGSIHISNQPWSIHSPERDTEAQIRAACEVWKSLITHSICAKLLKEHLRLQIVVLMMQITHCCNCKLPSSHSPGCMARNILNNQDLQGCSFHGWLFNDWPLDLHNSGAFRTGIGVVAHYSHNKVTSMTPSIIQTSMY